MRLLACFEESTPTYVASYIRGELNYRTEVFDVVDLPLSYNGILSRPALAKFMAASHYAYNTLKMSGPVGVISIPSDEKDAIICVGKMY